MPYFDALAPFSHIACNGENCVHPLSLTEYQGTSFGALARTKSVTFNEGKPASETVFAADGSVLYAVSYSYTDAGLLSEVSGADSSGAPKWAYRYEYSGEGRLLRETSLIFSSGKESVEGAVAFFYDGSGLLTKRETLSAAGAVTLSETFLYDESGRLSEKSSYYGDGVLLKREACEYAEADSEKVPQGVVARMRQYDSNGLYETTLFEYKDGLVCAALRYGADSVLKDSEAFYYREGKPVRFLRFNANGAPVAEESRLYDWAGNMVMARDNTGITIWEFAYPEKSFEDLQ